MPLLDVHNLKTYFHTRQGVVRAVDGVSFSLEKGETVGIVGESGCGKSVTCYSLLGLIPRPPGKIEAGTATFDSETDLLAAPETDLRAIRGKRISMIFQDPMTSLNPFLKISTQLVEPLLIHDRLDRKTALGRAVQELANVGIPNPGQRIHNYPHEFSGGMRQRVMIAMALITRPEILIADEPTTALDVTIQKQILDLIKQRQRDLGSAVILISHDLAVVSGFCDRVNVMYAGQILESAPTRELFRNPLHAYTRALQKSIPATHTKDEQLYTIPGAPPDLSVPIPGCPFAPRCRTETRDQCLRDRRPELVEKSPGHFVQNCPGCLGPIAT